jgi:hypothetical protein
MMSPPPPLGTMTTTQRRPDDRVMAIKSYKQCRGNVSAQFGTELQSCFSFGYEVRPKQHLRNQTKNGI